MNVFLYNVANAIMYEHFARPPPPPLINSSGSREGPGGGGADQTEEKKFLDTPHQIDSLINTYKSTKTPKSNLGMLQES